MRSEIESEFEHPTYRVAPFVYEEYDEAHGARFRPNSDLYMCFIKEGKVTWGTYASRSNRDGLGGRTTIQEYDEADLKVLVFGDSFTHWNQFGVTWPDLFERELGQRLKRTVGVLNYGRGTYGVIQMLELAAEKVIEHKPDFLIIAAVADDFTRGRWWVREMEVNGITRWMLSSKKDEFLDYRFATDELLVNSSATPEWCMEMVNSNGGTGDVLLRELNAQYKTIRTDIESKRRRFRVFEMSRPYLFNRIFHGTPYLKTTYSPPTIPRLILHDFSLDGGAKKSVQVLKESDVPIMLVYLPVAVEVQRRQLRTSRQSRDLMSSLEKMLNTKFKLIQAEYEGPAPAKIDLGPHDAHPNIVGLRFYAKNIVQLFCKYLMKCSQNL